MPFYRRNLPHWHPEGKCIFLTWRLYGSLPVGFLRGLRLNSNLLPAEEFRLAERLLDHPVEGPLWLREPGIADAVVETLIRGAFELHRYELNAFAVMANHVHVLLSPMLQVRKITREIKGFTARQANSILGRTGRRFWQEESFDHVLRTSESLMEKIEYIRQNPVRRGLVAKPEDYRWLRVEV